MPKIFSKSKKKNGLNDDPQHDDSMTIISSASMGGSSVSDRIMGRMKINLSSSFASNDSGGGGKRRSLSRSQSTGRRRFNSSAPNLDDPFGLDDTSTVSGGTGGGKSKRGSLLSRSQSARRFRSSDKSSSSKKGGGVSSVGVPSMEDMDSSESMALKGQSMGRRRSSRSVASGAGSNRRLGGSNRSLSNRSLGSSDINTVEYTLAQLRAMNEDELQRVMINTGVSQEDINNTIQGASNGSKDITKELVALFVNSGYVKLVAKPTTSSPVDSPSNTTTTIPQAVVSEQRSQGAPAKDEDKMARKTKLDKIAELKTANSLMKRENKSLKKTVKKLLGQLTDAVKEKSELQSKLDEAAAAAAAAKEEVDDGEADTENKAISSALDKEANEPLRKSSLSAIDETNTKYDTKSSQGSSSEQDDGGIVPAYIVPHNTTTSSSRRTSDLDESIDDSLRSENQTTTASSKQSISSDKSASNTITYLKRKLKKLKSSSENTEFRLKAEIDILTKEVDGLQRELGLTLESLDSSKKRASNLKVELRTASSKVNDLTREAEARDQLIDTFSGILLQKVGLESLTAAEEAAEEEKDSDSEV